MSLQFETKAAKKDYGRVEDGTYPARVVQIIDMGKQWSEDWKTGEKEYWDSGEPKVQSKCFIQFEFPTEMMEIDGVDRPRWQGKEFVVSNHEKAGMFKLMQAAGVNSVAALLGEPVLCSIGTTSGGNAKITTIAGMMKGMTVPELANPAVLYDLDKPDASIFEKLPPFVKEKINNQYDPSDGVVHIDPKTNEPVVGSDEDIPF